MLIIDANAILRYMLNDNVDMATTVNELILKNKVTVRYEVLAEVVYVFEKVYNLPRNEIKDGIEVFLSLPNVETETKDVLLLALNTYADKKLDFVDCLLYGFKAICGYNLFTFDKELNKLIKKI